MDFQEECMTVSVEEVEELIVTVTGREVTVDDLRAAGGSLVLAGLDSLQLLSLLDVLERSYGAIVESDDFDTVFESVDGLVAFLNR